MDMNTENNALLDDEDFIIKVKRERSRKPTKKAFLQELNDLRKADKNVEVYEEIYYTLTEKKLEDLDINGLNDLIIFIINQQLANERKENN